MRVCFISPQVPSGAYGRRGFSFMKHLAEAGISVTLHCIEDPGPVPDAAEKLKELGVDVRPVHVPQWKRWKNCLAGLPGNTPLRILHCRSTPLQSAVDSDLRSKNYDVLVVDRFRMAPYALESAHAGSIPVVVDFPDALSLYYERAVQRPRGMIERRIDLHEQRRIAAVEDRILDSGADVLVCSEVDRRYLKTRRPGSSIEVIPHTVETEEFIPQSRNDRSTVGVFTGTMKYFPNVDGLVWYYNEIHPLLGDDAPKIRVVGYGAGRALSKISADDRFDFTGYVERMADHLWTDDVYLCPLRVGAGVRNKLLEAFAAGMAAVSTTLGCEGIDVIPGEHLLVADNPQDFARAVRFLLNHPEERARIGDNARRLVVERHSPKSVRRQLINFLERAAGR